MAILDPQQKFLEIHRRLCATYGCPYPFFHDLDPVSELVSSLLSHRTKNRDSGRAFKNLRKTFPEWRDVMEAPREKVEAAIEAVTWPEQKAPRIQAILRTLFEETNGSFDLNFLAELEVIQARAWLERLPGIGPKTSAAVLNFSSLRIPALVVDCHHSRVAERLELIPKKLSAQKMHALLESYLPTDWDAQAVYDHHEVMMVHGQRICYFTNPACDRCPLLGLCPTGQRRLSGDVPLENLNASSTPEGAEHQLRMSD